MLKKHLWMLSALLLASILSACASSPDVPVCTEIAMDRGWCTYTISDKEFFIDDEHPYSFNGEKPQTWWEMRPFFVLVPPSSYAEIKSFVIKTCKKNNCAEKLGSWQRRIRRMDEQISAKK